MAWPKRLQSLNQISQPISANDRKRAQRWRDSAARNADIAILDFETDPFDNTSSEKVTPFLAILHSRQFDDIIIWEENFDAFCDAIIFAIETLPRAFTIYAHNGGKFDFMFLVHRLRGDVMFKGRGIMSATIGNHELRDSFHIIPERLATYRKDDFDYTWLTKSKRAKHREEIIDYCRNDCVYLLDIVLSFIDRYGRKLSIGQAAQTEVQKAGYKVQKLAEGFDMYLRNFYFGGRVECLAGIGHFYSVPGKQYKLYDVNSMYPAAMAQFQHPIGNQDAYTIRKGKPGPDTAFVEVVCNNYGALVKRMEDGSTSATEGRGRFFTTIFEYNAALELGLIDDVEIQNCVDCFKNTTFADFIIPTYEGRQLTKKKLAQLKAEGQENTREFLEVKKDDIFLKLLMNNAYGKYAQNPRRFKECCITNINERPADDASNPFGALPVHENHELGYAIWERPQKRLAFNNVGTAASITGAARAILMRAIANAEDPIYCDTDSLICLNLKNSPIHKSDLGAWDIEDVYASVVIAGKKMYACDLGSHLPEAKRYKIRSKGTSGMTWDDMLAILGGEQRTFTQFGPTMTRTGSYFYMSRRVRATGPAQGNTRFFQKRKAI